MGAPKKDDATRASAVLGETAKRDVHLVGRKSELAAIDSLLASGVRIITLRGVGGAGKTTLAREYARDAANRAHAGEARTPVHISLARSTSALDVIGTTARTLEVPLPTQASDDDAAKRLGAALSARGKLMIVLDNCEQLDSSAIATINMWSKAAGDSVFLITSRQTLGIDGEHELRIGPLAHEDALTLFVTRAEHAGPEWSPTEDAIADARALVDLLEGNALAIELAAAKTTLLSPGQILRRLTEPLDLQSEASDVEARHRSLRHVIDWSWQLLAPEEHACIAQCSMFASKFSLERAEALVLLPHSSPSVEAILAGLEKKSLLIQGSDRRFDLFHSVRAFAHEKLDELGIAEEVRARHAALFAKVAKDARARYATPDEPASVAMLAREFDDLLSAHDTLRRSDPTEASEITLAIHPLLTMKGPSHLHERLLGQAEKVRRGGADQLGALAEVLVAKATWQVGQGKRESANVTLTEAIALATSVNARATEADALRLRGALALEPLNVVCTYLHDSAELAASLGDSARESAARALAGNMLTEAGLQSEARESLDRALALAVASGVARLEANALFYLARHLNWVGALADAKILFERARDINKRLGDRAGEAKSTMGLAVLLCEIGDLVDARRELNLAYRIHMELGNRYEEAHFLTMLSSIDLEEGDISSASRRVDHASTVISAFGGPRDQALSLVYRANARLHEDRLSEAAEHLREAIARAEVASSNAFIGTARATLAIALALQDDGDGCEGEIERARGLLGRDHPLTTVASAFIDYSNARAAARHAPESGADESGEGDRIERARAHLAEAKLKMQNALTFQGPVSIASNVEVRTAAKLLARKIQDLVGDQTELATPERAIEWDPIGATIRNIEGLRLALGEGPSARIFRALCEARIATPGRGVSWSELAKSGWPADAFDTEAAFSRVRTTIARLRKMGLHDVIRRTEEGYLIDKAITLASSPTVGKGRSGR